MLNKKGFTLVELIVVITILSILGLIGFVSYTSYLSGTRDSKRITDLNTIGNGINQFLTKGKLPNPEEFVDIYSGTKLLGKQGYISSTGLETIGYKGDGVDPKDKTYYSYYLLEDGKTFQLMGFLEEEENLEVTYNITKKVNASDIDYSTRFPFFYGNKLGILTDSKNTPIQEVESVKTATKVDVSNTNELLIAHLKNNASVTGTGEVISELSTVSDVKGKFCDVILGKIVCKNLCATQPTISNAHFTIGKATVKNTPWQNKDYRKSCYYECEQGFSGDNCDVSTVCAALPLFVNEFFTKNTGTPINQNQSRQYNTIDGNCTYKCKTDYTWNLYNKCTVNRCDIDFYNAGDNKCSAVGIGYYSPNNDLTRTACTNNPDTLSRDYYYTSDGNGTNSCTATYTPKCGVDLYETSDGVCSAVGNGYYSPDLNNTRTACTNLPDNASRDYTYTSDGNGTNSCTASYTELCGVDLYESSPGVCSAVGTGYYSAANSNTRTACTNNPGGTYTSLSYTSDGNGLNACHGTYNTVETQPYTYHVNDFEIRQYGDADSSDCNVAITHREVNIYSSSFGNSQISTHTSLTDAKSKSSGVVGGETIYKSTYDSIWGGCPGAVGERLHYQIKYDVSKTF